MTSLPYKWLSLWVVFFTGNYVTAWAQEPWSFETVPSEDMPGTFALQTLQRPDGNTLEPANAVVASKTSSKFALKNPALLVGGDAGAYDFSKDSWTLSGWFYHAAGAGEMSGGQTLAGTRQSSSRFKGWDLAMVDGTIRFLTSPPRGEGRQFFTAKRYDDAKWHFFQLIWDVQSRKVTLTIDGETVGVAEKVPSNIGAAGQIFSIGAKIRGTQGSMQEWVGAIDEWKFEPSVAATPASAGPVVAPKTPAPVATAPVPVQKAGTAALRLVPLSGQVALTWKEKSVAGRVVLASGEPISEANRAKAQVVAENWPAASANDWYEDPAEATRKPAGPPRGWILTTGAAPLPREDGAFTYTFRPEDPAGLYFAVVAPDELIEPGRNATTEPVKRQVAALQPIAQSPAAVETMKKTPAGLPVLLYLHPHTSRPAGELTHLFLVMERWAGGMVFRSSSR